jgi:hypothetical protein
MLYCGAAPQKPETQKASLDHPAVDHSAIEVSNAKSI